MEDANPPGRCNWTPTTCFREASPRCAPRTSMPIVERTDAPTGAVTNSTAASVAVVGTGRIDRTWPTTLERSGRAGSDPGIRNHSPIRDDPMPTDVPVDDMDVRTILGVGEERQGGRTRPSGDACDSLVLWGREAAEGLAPRRRVRGTGGWGTASDSHAGADNWGLGLDGPDPAVGRARHKWPEALAGDKWVVHPAAAAFPHYSSDADMPCARAQRLAPATTRV